MENESEVCNSWNHVSDLYFEFKDGMYCTTSWLLDKARHSFTLNRYMQT